MNEDSTSSACSTGSGRRLPPWLKRRLPAGSDAQAVNSVRVLLDELGLATVCDGAMCPNRGECFASGTATFLILGDTCTRNCKFCAIPPKDPAAPRADEPAAVATAAERMGLKYVVITSVTRDDLPDGGAGHFAKTIRAVRAKLPQAKIEVLVPDFQGNREAIGTVISAGPDVFNHNIETAPRLYEQVRPQANYQQSLGVLACAKSLAGGSAQTIYTKSGLMVGLGETDDEVCKVMRDLRGAGCDILTIGQYLAPSGSHVSVDRFVTPEQFDCWQGLAIETGFQAAACGPFVRSSYHAKELVCWLTG
ncbi:MAG: lipoyl synthase [Planctomycetota bacterium]|nr:MAG: lipoyl synthase [Planctomycetota bacterium]